MSKPLRLSNPQILTATSLCLGYAAYYLCRSNLSVVSPMLLEDHSLHLDKASLGWITTIAIWSYACGKVINGILVDMFGGRRLFLFGMLGSIGCTLAFGAGSGFSFFVGVWGLNRLIQSAGWSALVKVSCNWFDYRYYGRVMGVLSLSFLWGDAVGRWFLSLLIQHNLTWREVFMAAAAVLTLVVLFCAATLRDHPRDEDLFEPLEANPHNLFTEASEPKSLAALLLPFLISPAFWTVLVMCFGMTLVRETFNFWIPQYLHELVGMPIDEAGRWSSLFPFVGGFSVLLSGYISDRYLKGRRGGLIAVTSVLVTLTLVGLGQVPAHSSPALPLVLIGLASLFLIGPYCFLGGAIAMDLGGPQAAATAAGLVDSAGYLGGGLSGVVVGKLAEQWGWGGAFGVLAAVSLATSLASALYWLRHEKARLPAL